MRCVRMRVNYIYLRKNFKDTTNIIFTINSFYQLRINIQKLVIFYFIEHLKCYFQILDLSINENLIMDDNYLQEFLFIYIR